MDNIDSPEVIQGRWDRNVRDIITANLRDGWADLKVVRRVLAERGTRRPAQDEHLSRMENQGKIVIDENRVRNA